ncbi:MAG: hypothetical protein M3P18_12070, partial [Actinomycetota bacterium]|nr:hypothetical protein [Actinomycetota bacterium]
APHVAVPTGLAASVLSARPPPRPEPRRAPGRSQPHPPGGLGPPPWMDVPGPLRWRDMWPEFALDIGLGLLTGQRVSKGSFSCSEA